MKYVVLIIVLVIVAGAYLSWLLFFQSSDSMNPSTSQMPSSSGILSSTPSAASSSASPILTTKYITTVDWPPKVQTLNQSFSCTEAGVETQRAGQTKQVIVNDTTYCVTKNTEGAAGSVYTQYAYALGDHIKQLFIRLV